MNASRLFIVETHACVNFCSELLPVYQDWKCNAAHADPIEWQRLARGLDGDIRQSQRIHKQVRRGSEFDMLCYYIKLAYAFFLNWLH